MYYGVWRRFAKRLVPDVDVLVVTRSYGYGIEKDARLLSHYLQCLGRTTRVTYSRARSRYHVLRIRPHARITIHVENFYRRWLTSSPKHILIPNCEFLRATTIEHFDAFDNICVKTRSAQNAFQHNFNISPTLLTFTSEDCCSFTAKNWSLCLHIAGNNPNKGTRTLVNLWKHHPEWPQLIVLANPNLGLHTHASNVLINHEYIDEQELRVLQNHCGIHICPSECEGWGHTILEGMSAGAIIVATDAPPMNEIVVPGSGVLVNASETGYLGIVPSYKVDPIDLEAKIEYVINLSNAAKRALSAEARNRYKNIDTQFYENLKVNFS